MADLPPRRLPTSFQQLVDVFERGVDAEHDQSSLEARHMGSQPISEVVTETISDVSDHSMTEEELDDDDLLDSEEEYLKEMEDERLADMKNGHFDGGFLPPILPTATREEAEAFIAQSFTADSMSLDTFVGEGNGQPFVNPGMRGGVSSRHGGADAFSDGIGQPSCMPTDTSSHVSMPLCMGNAQALIVEATQSLTSSINQGNNSSVLGNEKLLTDVYGEAAESLDLAENRPLVEKVSLLDQQNGPSLLGSASTSSAQVRPSYGPAPFPLISTNSNNSPQPNSKPPSILSPSAQTPQQPNPPHISTQPKTKQPKLSSHPYQTRSQKAKILQQHHKFKVSKPTARLTVIPASNPKNKAKNSSLEPSSQPASGLAGRELTAYLLAESSDLQPVQKPASKQAAISAQKSASMQPSASTQKNQN